MKFSLLSLAICGLVASTSFAQDATPPVVANAISDVAVSVNSGPTLINIKKTFALTGVTNKLVRFSTTLGNVDVELLADKTPQTVATFLRYANAPGDNNSGAASYTNTLIQRAVPSFIVQGGGFYIDNSGNVNQIVNRPTIASEAGVSNTRGTLAMALSNGPDSATGDWFFNLVDNTAGAAVNLDDSSDGGPFTVFGRVTGAGLTTLDAIAALKIVDASGGSSNSAFGSVPVLPTFNGSTIELSDLVYLNSVTNLPLTPKAQGEAAALTVRAKTSNPGLVTPTLNGRKLTLTYSPGQTGTAVVTVVAVDSAKTKVKAKFNVTVQ